VLSRRGDVWRTEITLRDPAGIEIGRRSIATPQALRHPSLSADFPNRSR
jgi:hypothetical protein